MALPQDIHFFKYQGTGNDFVMLDDRQANWDLSHTAGVRALCDRKFGIGADGFILIRNHASYDFEMVYFNADGSKSFCGNGSRCALAFAASLGIIQGKAKFLACDGEHEGYLQGDQIGLHMGDVCEISESLGDVYVNTGSPHHVRWVEQLEEYPVLEQGKLLRYHERYAPGGSNVNFVQQLGNSEIFVRTYERGVENETLSCGTGVTAAALVFGTATGHQEVRVRTLGGNLSVTFKGNSKGGFSDIWLIGPAQKVFSGTFPIALLEGTKN